MARTFGRLIALALLVLGFGFAPLAHASSCPSYDSAKATCETNAAYWTSQGNPHTCQLDLSPPGSGRGSWRAIQTSSGGLGGSYGFQCAAGFDPGGETCKARAPLHQAFDGVNSQVQNGGCTYKLKGDDDGAVKVCGVWNGKQFCTGSATFEPTGAYTGTPPTAPDPTPPKPKVCQGGSCYDPATDQYCAAGDSGQVCVPARSGSGGGSCVTGGSTTLCAGSPAPTPPNPPVSDPASQIAGSDNYSDQRGGPSKPVSNTTVNNYNGTGSGAKNGAGQGDTGAPSTGTGDDGDKKDDGTSAGGGGDCNTPPMVEGSPALGMIARQTWLLRCADAGQGSDDSDKSVPGLDDIPEKPGDGTFKEVSMLDKIDQSGFGGGTQCPSLPSIDLGPFGHMDMNSDWWCEFLERISWAVLLTGAWLALRILGER
jgi:hypothetical protein